MSTPIPSRCGRLLTPAVCWLAASLAAAAGPSFPAGPAGFASGVRPFLEATCAGCHEGDDPKGGLAVAELAGLPWTADQAARWDRVLEVLERGEMPPEDEAQPEEAERAAVVRWLRAGLEEHARQLAATPAPSTARRLTNVEYENTIRDLLGFRLQLIDTLPQDPVKPYRFNNTPDMMRIGPEQIDLYLECSRRAMAAAIVDPGPPQIHRSRTAWLPTGVDRGLGQDEIEIQTVRRRTAGEGMGVTSRPASGEFRIRFQASAVLPPGIAEMPLRIVMGEGLHDSTTRRIIPVGTVRLSGGQPEVFELRGRIEDVPGSVITPQNLYDDGTLNDENQFLYWPRRLSMPRAVVNWMEFECPVADVWPPEHHTRILFESPLRESDPPAYLRAVLERFMARAYRRPATAAEVERFVAVHELARAEGDSFDAALRETLALVLVSPQFLYHATAADPGLRHFAIASRLSYFLWASMPDDELLGLARAGRLDDPGVIAAEIERLLADERSLDFVRTFTTQWLSLAKLKTVPINRELFPRFLYVVSAGERLGVEQPYRPTIRDHMLAETAGFVAELIRRNAAVAAIVDSDFAMLNQPLAAHYGVAGVQGHELRPVPIRPEHQLGGLLTHGSVLVANGTGSAPHPIYRAVWLREAILGDDVAPPPAEVPALVDSAGEAAANSLAIADLLALHRRQESCNDCHVRLDPWGIPFEHYNAVGRYQPLVPKEGTRVRGFDRQQDGDLAGYAKYLASINTVAVQAAAKVPHGPEVEGLRQLKDHLLRERLDMIGENVIRRFLAYALGRDLTYRDRFAVERLAERLRPDGYRLRDLIVAICTSDLFRGLPQEDDAS